MKKKIKSTLSLFCAAFLCTTTLSGCEMLGLDLGNLGNNNSSSSETGGGNSSAPEKGTDAASFVSLDINPSIELTVDSENKVVSVYGANEDGKVLLYEETGIVGEDVELAVEKIVELAVELGYLDENNKIVGTGVVSEDSDTESALTSKINAKVTATAQDLGLQVTTDGKGAYSLLRELDALKAAYPESQAIQNVSASKFKLAVSAAETGEVTLEAAVEMDVDELVELVANAHTQMEAFATEAYEAAKLEASMVFEKALGMAKAGVYLEYSTGKLQALPYGASYFMYEASASGFEACADGLACVERLRDYELSESQIEAVLSALALEDTSENRALLENSDGKITVKSVEAYADKLFKNTPVSAELEATKTALNEALTEAEALLEAEIAQAKETYGPQIEQIITTAEGGVTVLKPLQSLLPASLKQAVTDFESVAANVRTAIETNEFSEGTLRQLAKEMDEKAAVLLEEFKAKLTEEELAELETKLAEVDARYAAQKAEMESKIAQAEQTAKAKLEALKNARQAS